MEQKKQVWFVTGASKGLGLSLVKQLLAAGHRVAATSRRLPELKAAVGVTSDQFLPLETNLSDEKSVAASLGRTLATFGRLDVVVNNAGYGIGGSVEELSDAESRQAFEINVFATLNVIRYAMPYLREQGAGHIINIASIAGFAGGPGWSVYSASKHAIVGLSEGLAQDVSEFGIKVSVVAPGAFRTSFLTPESLVLTSNPIDAYTTVRAIHTRFLQMNGKQAGDPEKAAEAMMRLASEKEPPLYVLLGSDAYQRATAKVQLLGKTFSAQEAFASSTDYEVKATINN